MTTDAPVADSSPAEPVPAAITLDSLTADERAQWRMTGEFPTSDASAESSPAEPAAQAASTDATPSPASEPGTTPKKKGADARIQELLAERHELRTRLEALERQTAPASAPPRVPARTPDVPPAVSSTVAADKFPKFAEWAEQPGNADKDYDDYLDARDTWRDEFRARQAVEQARAAERARAVETRTTAFQRQFSEAVTADPEVGRFAESLPVPVDHLPPGEPATALHVLSQEIYQSPHAIAALKHFAANPAEVQRFAALSSADAIARAFGRLEALWEAPSTSESPSAASPVSAAPPPPVTLGAKPSAPGLDDAEAALARGDFKAYREAMNRRESRR